MSEPEKSNDQINSLWEVIKSSGCSEIQDAIAGRNPSDFDPEILEWMANLF